MNVTHPLAAELLAQLRRLPGGLHDVEVLRVLNGALLRAAAHSGRAGETEAARRAELRQLQEDYDAAIGKRTIGKSTRDLQVVPPRPPPTTIPSAGVPRQDKGRRR